MRCASIPRAKFTPPDPTGLVPRPRLFRLLDRARRRAVVWVAGPPGSGKTSLVASYLRSRRVPAMWYRMDEGDADPALLCRTLAQAARRSASGRWTPLPPVRSPSLTRLAATARRYFRELYARLSPHGALVLDNYHVTGEHADLNRVIAAALSEIPEGLTLIVVSRHAPPPVFARLQASRRLTVLGWNDLRLSRAEAHAIGRAHGGSRLPQAARSVLTARAAGWVAGLTLLRDDRLTGGATDPSAAQADPRPMRDYFDAEVFAHLGRRARTLLLTTAYLETLTPEAAVRLSGMRDAGAILSELARCHLFVEEHARGPNAVYRYHPMFRDFLIVRAEHTFRPPALRRVQRAAAQALLAAGSVADAADLLGRTGDAPSLAELIRQHAGQLVREGREQTVHAWLSRLPPRLLRADPWLGYWSGVCRLSADPTASLAHFERAAEGFAAQGDRNGQWASAVGALRAILIESRAFRRMDHWIEVIDRLSQGADAFPPAQFADQAIPAILFALTLHRPDHPGIEQWVARAHSVLEESSHPTARLESGYALVTWYNWRGEVAHARTVVGSLRWLATARHASALVVIMWRVSEATCELFAGQFETGTRAVVEGLKIARAAGIHVWDAHLAGFGALGALSAGDLREAQRGLAWMDRALRGARTFDRALYHLLSIWRALLARDLPHAAVHARLVQQTASDLGATLPEAGAALALAHVAHEQGHDAEAAGHLRTVAAVARRMASPWVEFMGLLAEAHVAFDRADEAAGVAALQRAMALGRAQGFGNALLWHPHVMARLCVKALEHGIEPDYVRHLITQRKLVPETPPVEVEDWPWPLRIYTVGRFSVVRNGSSMHFLKKPPHKPLRMLKAIIALGGRQITENQITDVLWPEADGDRAHKAFSVTLTRLRRLLGTDHAVVVSHGRVSLNPTRCWVDTWAFERLVSGAGQPAKIDPVRRAKDASAARRAARLERAATLYQGPFLPDEGDEPWLTATRERLKAAYLHCLRALGQYWIERGEWAAAAAWYEKGVESDELAEESYQHLIACYVHLGRHAEARSVYQRCERLLGAHLGIQPSEKTKALVPKG